MKSLRARTLSAVAALVMTGALTACNDSAPSAVTPSSTPSQSSPQSDTSTSADSSSSAATDSSATSDSPSSDTSSSPTASSASGSGGGAANGAKCKASYVSDPSEADDKTTMKKWGESGTATDQYGRKFTVKVSPGTITEPGSDDEYSFDRDETGLVFKVSIDYDPGSSGVDEAYMTSSQFTLRDPGNNICDTALDTSLSPDNDPLMKGSNLTARTKHLDGTLVFKVPVGSDPKKFVLTYSANLLDTTANLGWKA